MTQQIYFITGNAGKVHEAKYSIGNEYFKGSMNCQMAEIQSDDYVEIITQKAQSFIDNNLETWCKDLEPQVTEIRAIVEDTGFEIDNMNGFPGPYIRYYFDKLGLQGICKFNGGSKAAFVSHSAAIVIHRNHGLPGTNTFSYTQDIKVFSKSITGIITLEPQGTKGFGFDPIFVPDGCYQTLGEMDIAEKLEYSARMQSIKLASEWLISHNK